MRNIVKVSVAALGLMLGLSSCDSFFAEMPGIRYDIEMSFKDQVKTKAFLANVYSLSLIHILTLPTILRV